MPLLPTSAPAALQAIGPQSPKAKVLYNFKPFVQQDERDTAGKERVAIECNGGGK